MHIEVLGHEWRQKGAGIAQPFQKLPGLLDGIVDAGDAWPRVVASDRGPGFYQTSTGHITREYESALKSQGFRAFAGADASSQPPDVPDVLLHETVVAWIRKRLKVVPFSREGGLDAQEMRLRHLFKECAEHINANFQVEELFRDFPKRLRELKDSRGERLKH